MRYAEVRFGIVDVRSTLIIGTADAVLDVLISWSFLSLMWL